MPKISDTHETARYHVVLFKDDYELLRNLYGETIGTSTAIRNIIHKALKATREKALQNATVAIPVEVEIENLEDDSQA